MAVFLRDFEKSDLATIDVWAHRIGSDNYMSRYLPRGSTTEQPFPESILVWCIIVADGAEVGVVWLERDVLPNDARLGILLGDVNNFGHGIGKRAINLAIERAKSSFTISNVRLNVRENNPRAIACYKKCGFEVVGTGVKEGLLGCEIRYLIMECNLGEHHAT